MNKGILVVLLTVALSVGAGCGGSEPTGGTGGSNGNGGDAGGDEFLVATRVRTPDSRALFLSVLPDLDHGVLDLGDAIEVSGVSRARVYEGKVFVFDGESLVITRYVVEDGVLIEDVLEDGRPARFSMMNEGINGFTNAIAFISPTRAYYIDVLAQEQTVVWNPTEMEITSRFDVPQVSREGFGATGGNVVVLGDFVAMPISWANLRVGTFVPTASMLVLSASDDRVIDLIEEEERCVLSSSAFVDAGAVFLVADKAGGIADLATDPPGDLPPPCLLRWTPGAAEFDPEFYLDLAEVTGHPLTSGALGRGDGTFMTQVYTSDIDHLTLEPQQFVDDPLWQWAVIDYETESSTLVEPIALGGVSSTGWVVDDAYHATEFNSEAGTSKLFEVDAPSATERLSVTGEIFTVDRIQ